MEIEHKSVLLKEAIEYLKIKSGGRYIDCNLGGGGHTKEILDRGGKVLGIDVDQVAIDHVKSKMVSAIEDGQLQIKKHNFADLDFVVKEIGWNQGVNGILYDLGLSTFQIKAQNKGFSFKENSMPDMRMDDTLGPRAIDLLHILSEKQLSDLIYKYGEEPQAARYAKILKLAIKETGKSVTSVQLARSIEEASIHRSSRIHPATRVFQALRIVVNSELDNLSHSLEQAVPLLRPAGRLVIISFHSLEDRIAKRLKESPVLRSIVEKPISPSEKEISENPSSRSAKMRVYEKK